MAILGYTPELGETKPEADGTCMLSHYAKHYFVRTGLTLKGRGIVSMEPGRYKVTIAAFDKLNETYNFSENNALS